MNIIEIFEMVTTVSGRWSELKDKKINSIVKMKIKIKRLRFDNQYFWNLNGRESKLFINGTTFTPRSKQLGLKLREAVKEANV